MCDSCHETADGYDGDSVSAQQTQAIRAVIARHPELGLESDEFAFRYAPKDERECVRVNTAAEEPRFEIHSPSYSGKAANARPPLTAIAIVALVQTSLDYDAICDILEIDPVLDFGAAFLTDHPPVRPDPGEPEALAFEHSLEGSED